RFCVASTVLRYREMPPMPSTSARRVSTVSLISAAVLAAIGLQDACAQGTRNFPVIGTIHRFDPQLDELIPKDAKIEVLSSRFQWAEGPVWDKASGTLLF